MLLFFVLFRLLARPHEPGRALWQGALLGAVGVRGPQASLELPAGRPPNQPAFQAFGIALVLLVWINYFSRIVMYAAAWAHTSRPARAARAAEQTPPGRPTYGAADRRPRSARPPRGRGPDPRLAFGAGAATALGLVALVRRRRR